MSTQDSPFDPNEMNEPFVIHTSDFDNVRVHKLNANTAFLLNNAGGGEGGSVALKTINGATLKGTGNITLPTPQDLASLSDKQQQDHNAVVGLVNTERLAREAEDVATNARVVALETQDFKTVNGESIKGTANLSLVKQEVYDADKAATQQSISGLTVNVEAQEGRITGVEQRVQSLEANQGAGDVEIKTLNGESLKGTGNIEVPTKQYVDDSVTALVQSVNAVTQAVTTEQAERVQADSAMENTISALDVRVKAIEDAPITPVDIELKTINGESVEGVGDIVVATPSQVNEAKAEVVLKIDTELAAETQARETADEGLDARVQALESATPTPLAFKTVNGEQLLGQGDIELATKAEMTSATDRITVLEQHDATHDNQLVALQDAVALKIEDAPSDGRQYTRKDGTWEEVQSSGEVAVDLKTINGESLEGVGDLSLVTPDEITLMQTQINDTFADVYANANDVKARVEALENTPEIELATINGLSVKGTTAFALVDQAVHDQAIAALDQTIGGVATVVGGLETSVANLTTTVGEKVEEAPQDGKQYARVNGVWAEVEAQGEITVALKTINGETLEGTGDITLPKQEYVDGAIESVSQNVLGLYDLIVAEGTSRADADTALSTRIEALEQAPTPVAEIKTINGETMVGVGDVALVTPTQLTDATTPLDERITELENTPAVAATWDTLEGKPAFIGAGDTQALARDALGINSLIGAKLSDSPRDGNPYVRKDGQWVVQESDNTEFKTINGELVTGTGNIVTATSAEVDTKLATKADAIHTHTADDVAETAGRIWFTSSERSQITANTSEVASHSQRIADLEAGGGSGGGTDEKVKLNATGNAGYLENFIDNQTIVSDGDMLYVAGIEGVNASPDEINSLVGVTGNIQAQINSLSTVGKLREAVQTYADLLAIADAQDTEMVIVLADESKENKSTIYIHNGTAWVFGGEFKGGEVRDFTEKPINLVTEVTGQLPKTFYVMPSATDVRIADASNLFTGETVEAALTELFTYANSIKTQVAAAVGNPLTATDTAQDMAIKIRVIKTDMADALVQKGVVAYSYNTLPEMIQKIKDISSTTLDGGVKSTEINTLAVNGTISVTPTVTVPNNQLCTSLIEYTDGAKNAVHFTKTFTTLDNYTHFEWEIVGGKAQLKEVFKYTMEATSQENGFYMYETAIPKRARIINLSGK